MRPYRPSLKETARTLRKNMTDAEQLLWSSLRRRQMGGVQFYRQRPILDYVVDFYAPAVRLVVEVDGGQHFTAEAAAYDLRRTRRIEALGLCLLRFDNGQVFSDLEGLLAVVAHHCHRPTDAQGHPYT